MNTEVLAPLVRIFLRWLGGFLVAKGFAPGLLDDPALVQTVCFILAGLCGLISEGWWYLARKNGWGQ